MESFERNLILRLLRESQIDVQLYFLEDTVSFDSFDIFNESSLKV